MEHVTLALAILLGTGFLVAKLVQLIRLPSVTGYICAGLLLGPSGLAFITPEQIGNRLDHFSQIALMLIAFGIGEHLELKRLRGSAQLVGVMGLAESFCAFALVFFGIFGLAFLPGVVPDQWGVTDYFALALLLASVAVATAPASTLHVVRETKAAGPLASTLMQVVALDNGLAIMMFGIAVSTVHHLAGTGGASVMTAVAMSFTEIIASILMGILTGLLIDLIAHRLGSRGEILTIGLALLLLCGELARLFGFSPLLAGMAAGFTIVNRDHRDVRFFRALNAFEIPVYVLFFTLAGVHLDITSLAMAGLLGLVYFLLRVCGKIAGVRLSSFFIPVKSVVGRNLGQALMPQAGLAIGLLFLIKGDAVLKAYSFLITPVVLAGVLLAEIIGPVCTKIALERAGETAKAGKGGAEAEFRDDLDACPLVHDVEAVQLVPWTWERLVPPVKQEGVVLFGAAHHATVAAIARMTTILAHHHKAKPFAVRVVTPELVKYYKTIQAGADNLFAVEKAEVQGLGYSLETAVVKAENVASGILRMAVETRAKGIVLGYPVKGTAQAFLRVLEAVARDAPCEVVVFRFSGKLHTECILVPLVDMAELATLQNVICALSGVGRHRITLFRLLPSEASKEDRAAAERELAGWAKKANLGVWVRRRVVATEARTETIVQEAGRHDLLVMAASQTKGLRRLFFGSLAEGVASRCNRPMLIVHGPKPGASPSSKAIMDEKAL